MLKHWEKNGHTLFVAILLALTVVDYCSGQRNRPRSQRMNARTTFSTGNNQRATLFGNSDNYGPVSFQHNSLTNLINGNNRGVYSGNGFYATNQQSNNRRSFTLPQTNFRHQNSLTNARTHRGATSRTNVVTNTLDTDYHAQTQGGVTQNRFSHNSFNRGRNHNSRNQNQLPRGRRGSIFNLPGSTNRQSGNRGLLVSNMLPTSQSSRFSEPRNRFGSRSFSGTPRGFVPGLSIGESGYQVNPYESLSVPLQRYQIQRRRMNGFHRNNIYRSNYIPEATSLPSGLEFMGRSYAAKQALSASRNNNGSNHWRSSSRRTPGIIARALGNILGISSQTITDIASTPTVFQRTKDTLEANRHQSSSPDIGSSGLLMTHGSNNYMNAKTQLLTNIGESLNQLTGGLYGDHDYVFNGESDMEEAGTISIRPVRTIIISDSNTFTKLKSDAAATGSLIGAIPPSAIDENLLNDKPKYRQHLDGFSPDFAESSESQQQTVRVETVDKSTSQNVDIVPTTNAENIHTFATISPHIDPVVRTVMKVKRPLSDKDVRVTTLLSPESYFDPVTNAENTQMLATVSPNNEPVVRTVMRVKKPLSDRSVRVTTLLSKENYFDPVSTADNQEKLATAGPSEAPVVRTVMRVKKPLSDTSVRVSTLLSHENYHDALANAENVQTLDYLRPNEDPVVRTVKRVKKPLTDRGVRVSTLLPEENINFDPIFGELD